MKWFTVCTVTLLLCLTSCHADEDNIDVTDGSQLVKFFKGKPSPFSGEIKLMDDITLSLSNPLGFDTGSQPTHTVFGGKLEGNNHTIKCKSNNTQESSVSQYAGLFYGLQNALIQNLIIDHSCNFTGIWSGALSPFVNGSVNVDNVHNYATVIGQQATGGFFGGGENIQGVLHFTNCTNSGSVSQTEREDFSSGGFIGLISSYQEKPISFHNCTNNGKIEGNNLAGGFIGIVNQNTEVNISFESSINQGEIKTNRGGGGFIGAVYGNKNTSISFSSCQNNAFISGESELGGFVGAFASNSDLVTFVKKSQNTGEVNGTYYTGGFIGNIYSSEQEHNMSIFVENSANYGSIKGVACGFFCVNLTEHIYVKSYVNNCLNNGTLEGNHTFGISTKVTSVHNFVNLGELKGNETNYCFFYGAESNSSIYSLRKCNCNESHVIEKSSKNGLYYTTSKHQVDEQLNKEAAQQNYSAKWTSNLELVEQSVSITFGNPHNTTINLALGGSLQNALEFFNLTCDDYITVERKSWQPLECSSPLNGHTNAALCYHVTASGVTVLSELIENGKHLGDSPILQPFFTEQYLVSDVNDKNIRYNKTTQVLKNMNLSITKLSTIEIVIVSDDDTELNEDKIKNALIEAIDSPDNDFTEISVIREDNKYTVTVIVSEEKTDDIKERFTQCIDTKD